MAPALGRRGGERDSCATAAPAPEYSSHPPRADRCCCPTTTTAGTPGTRLQTLTSFIWSTPVVRTGKETHWFAGGSLRDELDPVVAGRFEFAPPLHEDLGMNLPHRSVALQAPVLQIRISDAPTKNLDQRQLQCWACLFSSRIAIDNDVVFSKTRWSSNHRLNQGNTPHLQHRVSCDKVVLVPCPPHHT